MRGGMPAIHLLYVDDDVVVANKPSGLLVHRGWANDAESRQVDKRYLALVRGEPSGSGVIDHPIPRGENGPLVAAVTRFTLIARSRVDRCSLVLAIPETGRSHQIRRHLRHLRHPLEGDVNYGSGEINRHYRAAYDLHRLALHAHAIGFDHPVSGARVSIAAPMPDDLGLALERLGLPRTAADESSVTG